MVAVTADKGYYSKPMTRQASMTSPTKHSRSFLQYSPTQVSKDDQTALLGDRSDNLSKVGSESLPKVPSLD
jgi:hypothetical protein